MRQNDSSNENTTTATTTAKTTTTTLGIIHFNDVYNVEEQKSEPFAGAARFLTAINHYNAGSRSLVLFSGDALSPSMISTVTQGQHMPHILNAMNIGCAVLGNHDLDFGLDILCECLEQCSFPWLNSNVYDRNTQGLLANTEAFKVINHDNLTIGIIGLLEKEWVATLSCIDSSDVYVADICEVGRSLAKKLKTPSAENEQRPCDLVIALTHMRWPNDRLIAQNVPEIDLVLGGHDHNYGVEWIDGSTSDDPPHRRAIIKSGSDFREFSYIQILWDHQIHDVQEIRVERVLVNGQWQPDPNLASYVSALTAKLDRKLDLVIGTVDTSLDALFSSVRMRETNVGNLICDIILTGVNADAVMLNSGTLRADRIIPSGEFTLRDLTNLLPLLDPLVVLQSSGAQILAALENGVSQYPKLEGRFPLVAGVRFSFDPSKPFGQRIDGTTVSIQGQPLELDKSYRLCVKHYMAEGKDGYDVLRDCPVLLDDENGPILSTLIQNYFRTVQVIKGFQRSRTNHRQSIVSIVERQRLLEQTGKNSLPGIFENSDDPWDKARWVLIVQREKQNANKIAPTVDGRIRNLRESV
ncbi:Snake venom 5'-nucleotidase [Fasciola hepatica]|uniref:Snake venom 5'-nucleotidase n=1 Tax=Fasciola hepatica TaxID=6192 RepID=A0A4E0S2W3_FASHE|nr:Snake venom 5'-nucleotidase [Fasciola hepatica]